jgi:hypothetical protein
VVLFMLEERDVGLILNIYQVSTRNFD